MSIIVLNYNYARFLGQAIESSLQQSIDERPEVLVVDDGSTDGSLSVARSFEPYVRVHAQANGGMCSAMNAAIRLAHGDGVIVLDADDVLHPQALRIHMANLSDSRVVRSMGRMRIVNADGRPTGRSIPGVTPDAANALPRTLEYGPGAYVSPPTSGNAWRRTYLHDVAPIPEPPVQIGAETFLMDTAPLYGEVAWTPHTVADYRQHRQNMHHQMCGLSDAALTKVLQQYDVRSAFLQRKAAELGTETDRARWYRRNWRIQLIRTLLERGSEQGAAAMLRRAVRKGSPQGLKRVVLVAAMSVIASSPSPVDRRLARLFLQLSHL